VEGELKPVRWMGASLRDLRSFPRSVRIAVYTVRFQDAIYVLHVFQKKSTRGIATPARQIDLIKQRLAEAERDYRERELK
jgi:phage-related protein